MNVPTQLVEFFLNVLSFLTGGSQMAFISTLGLVGRLSVHNMCADSFSPLIFQCCIILTQCLSSFLHFLLVSLSLLCVHCYTCGLCSWSCFFPSDDCFGRDLSEGLENLLQDHRSLNIYVHILIRQCHNSLGGGTCY